MSKEYCLLKYCLIEHHSMFKGYTAKQKEKVLANPLAFNVEYLIEQAIAEVGGLVHTDANHSDYGDSSDCKTASIANKSSNKCPVKVFGVAKKTHAGISYKHGDLRTVVYNPHTNQPIYYFFPKAWWVNHVVIHSTQGWGYFYSSYNKKTDTIIDWDQFRCTSFEELARAKSTI